jgi:ligand-binding SRPBCC domain-containing protein
LITVELDTFIHAPRELCFDLALDVDIHAAAESRTKERIAGGRASGRLRLGETVTFEAVHFGIRQRLTSKVISFDRPSQFTDQMQEGAFSFLRHTHTFVEDSDGTLMRDRLDIAAPLGPIGWIAERVFLARYMRRFLVHHQDEFRKIVECYPMQ